VDDRTDTSLLRRQDVCRVVVVAGLLATSVGFVAAAIDPGEGPRVVEGGLTVGPLYLPPMIVGVVLLGVIGLVAASRTWWSVAVATAVALVLLVGSFTITQPPRSVKERRGNAGPARPCAGQDVIAASVRLPDGQRLAYEGRRGTNTFLPRLPRLPPTTADLLSTTRSSSRWLSG
jgi:hypothetical protein